MFGVRTFAQAPFAALPAFGGAVFVDSMIENVGIDDSSTQLFSFLQSITEPITEIDDFNSQAGLFFGTINEVINVDDTSAQVFDALQSIRHGRRICL